MNDNSEYNYEIKHIIYLVLGIGLAIFAYFNIILDEESIKKEAVVKSSSKAKPSTKDIQEKNEPKKVTKNITDSLSNLQYPTKKEKKESNTQQTNRQTPPTKNATMAKDFAKCYNLGEGSYIIDYKCKKNILSYIKKHKDAKYFEIIGIVDGSEFKLYKNLENNKILYNILGVTEASVKLMKKLTNSGLAKHRAIEASWVIKVNTNHTAITYNPHYHILSTEGKKGMLVRAYK